jgi:hypothetical protein
MIIIIDTHNDECYHTKFLTKAALKIGVHRVTLSRWVNGGRKSEKYNHLKVYLKPNKL